MSDGGFDVRRSETDAILHGCGLHTSGRELLWVRGKDAEPFLEGLLSQTIAGVAPGAVTRSFLLAPTGKLRALLFVLHGAGEVGLVTDGGLGSTVEADLTRFMIRVDVTIEIDSRPMVEMWGPRSGAVLDATDLPTPEGWESDPLVARLPFPLTDEERYLLIGADTSRLVDSGAELVGHAVVEALRIEQGEPVMGRDVDEATIPQETGMVGISVDFDKGCFLGQELVARIDSRGHVNRHLRGLVITEDPGPPSGADLVVGDSVVGRVASVAAAPGRAGSVALGLVRREVDPGASLEVRWDEGSTRAVVHELPIRLDPVR